MKQKVTLAIYDLSRGMARSMSFSLLGKQVDGIWHTGIICYGQEHFFSGGLQSMPHERFCAMHQGFRPDQLLELGETEVAEGDFRAWMGSVAHRFTAQTYNLMRHNCNNFTDEASNFLLGRGIPSYIIDLPREVLSTPSTRSWRPR